MTDTFARDTTTQNGATQDPAEIEREIRRTQEDMSRTVDKIGSQFSAKNIVNALLDKADQNNVDARMLLQGARNNPMALGLIAAGTIWLISDKDSRFPSFGPKESKPDRATDSHHREYVSHMSAVEMREGEDPAAYQRRRDQARSNYFMLERGHEEDDSSFRQRLDHMTEEFRAKRKVLARSGVRKPNAVVSQTKALSGKASEWTTSTYSANPLVGGLIAAAVGAAFGSALPISQTEQERLGDLGEKARDMASEQKDTLTEQVRDKKDQLLDKVDERLSQSPMTEGGTLVGGGQQTQQQPMQSRPAQTTV